MSSRAAEDWHATFLGSVSALQPFNSDLPFNTTMGNDPVFYLEYEGNGGSTDGCLGVTSAGQVGLEECSNDGNGIEWVSAPRHPWR
jgi:hypothetical protein